MDITYIEQNEIIYDKIMGLFNRGKKYDSLSQAIRANDLKSVRKLLESGVDPNLCDVTDTGEYPIFYAIHKGPEMVQLLIKYGANLNVEGKRKATPLACSIFDGREDVAAILRKEGANLNTSNKLYTLNPEFRLQIEKTVKNLQFLARVNFPGLSSDEIAIKVEEKMDFKYSTEMSFEEKKRIEREIHDLILNECRKGI